MVKVRENLVGKVFERLTVLEQVDDYIRPSNGQHEAQWVCECSCEEHTIIVVKGNDLKNGHVKSCGCLRKDVLQSQRKKYNKFDVSGEFGIGWTSNTNKEFYFDLKHFDKIKDICWIEHCSSKNFSTLIGYIPLLKKEVKMHIYLGYKEYDHIDHNELNNLESNLRLATHQENQCNMQKRCDNTSGITGVVWNKDKQKWVAQIQYRNKMHYLGGFINKDDAIYARLQAEQKYFGDFAPQKHLYEKYNINTIQNDFNKESEK